MTTLHNERLSLYEALGRVRPAQLGVLLKRCLLIKRGWAKTTSGEWFWVDPVSVFGYTVLKHKVYEPRLSEVIKILLRPNDCFIDIGANEGYFSILAATQVGQHGKVYCIEPQGRLQTIINKNIIRNQAKAISQHQIALNNGQDKVVQLYLRPDSNSGASSMFRHWKLGHRTETVNASSLDQFCKEHCTSHVRLVKIDCEGAEHLVIQGAKQFLQRQMADFISLEYHTSITGKGPCEETHQILYNAGYILTRGDGFGFYHLTGLEKDLAILGDLQINCSLNAYFE